MKTRGLAVESTGIIVIKQTSVGGGGGVIASVDLLCGFDHVAITVY